MQKNGVFEVGTQVEVTSNIKGLTNSWYKATIIPPPKSKTPSKTPRNKSLWVEYETIFDNENPSKKLQEFTDTLLIRPLPPKPRKGVDNFEKFEFVDVFYKEGWFTGVILDVFDNGLKYLVAFLNPYEEFVFLREDVRVHFDWLGGGKWTKAYRSQKVNVAFCPPNVGETVVASQFESTSAVVSPVEQSPSPAKKLNLATSGHAEETPSSYPNHAVQSRDAPEKFLQPRPLTPSSKVAFCPPNVGQPAVDSLLESTSAEVSPVEQPPSPAEKLNRATSGDAEETSSSYPDHAVQSRDAPEKFLRPRPLTPNSKVAFGPPNVGEPVVDSLLESTSAVVRPVEQAPSPAKKLKHSGDSEARPSSDPNHSLQSLDATQQFLQPCPLTSSKGDTHYNGKRKASDGENYSSLSFSPNDNVPFCPPNGGETVVASLLESTPTVVSPVEQAPTPAKKLKRTTSTLLLLLAKDQEDKKKNDAHSGSPAKGNQVTKVVEVIHKLVKVKDELEDCGSKAPVSYSEPAATECPEARPVTTCFNSQVNKSQSWPFTKRSETWKVIDTMEVFKRIPQMPHFSPLNEYEEKSREMLAICLMMKFSYEAERISAGSPDDLNSSESILDSLKSLEELESHGFNVFPLQDYLTDLFFKMEEEKELKGNLEEAVSEINKLKDEIASSESKLKELAKQQQSLQEQMELEKSGKCMKDRQLAILESHMSFLSRNLHSRQLTMKHPFMW